MTFTVSAPLIAVTADGVRHSLYFGAVVPSGVKGEDLDRLQAGGFIKRTGDAAATVEATDDAPTAEAVKAPARSGPGSGRAAWQAYAVSLGVEVADGSDRDAIIAAIEKAEKPTD